MWDEDICKNAEEKATEKERERETGRETERETGGPAAIFFVCFFPLLLMRSIPGKKNSKYPGRLFTAIRAASCCLSFVSRCLFPAACFLLLVSSFLCVFLCVACLRFCDVYMSIH